MSGQIAFAVAGPPNEGEIRRLLRENPVGGAWPISLEREPDGLGGPEQAGERRCFILARDTASGQAVGLCERVVRPAWVNGEASMVPYLGALRIAESHRRRVTILKGGFAALRTHAEQADECPFALTSITADNSMARRVLTAGIKGLPCYLPAAEYATLILRPRRARPVPAISGVASPDLDELAAFLASAMRHRQFAPCWSAADLAAMTGAQWLVLRRGGEIAGAALLWDRRACRQVVVRGYPAWARRLRPLLNCAAPLAGMPKLPPIGSSLPQAFLSGLTAHGDDPDIMLALIAAGLDRAASAGLGAAVIGLPAGHAWRGVIRARYRTFDYTTALYLAHWSEHAAAAQAAAQGQIFPDVALL